MSRNSPVYLHFEQKINEAIRRVDLEGIMVLQKEIKRRIDKHPGESEYEEMRHLGSIAGEQLHLL